MSKPIGVLDSSAKRLIEYFFEVVAYTLSNGWIAHKHHENLAGGVLLTELAEV